MSNAQIWYILISSTVLAFIAIFAITSAISDSISSKTATKVSKAVDDLARVDPAEFPRWGA